VTPARARAARLLSLLSPLALVLAQPARAAAEEGQQRAQRGPSAEDELEVDRIEAQVKAIADRLALTEREYGSAEDPSELLELRRRYAEAETQYLLGEYGNAAALLYDVCGSPAYFNEESRPDALFYLADSLFRQASWIESRRYFHELAQLRVPRLLQDSLLRLIELSDKVGDQQGIEEIFAALVQQAGSADKLKPEVVYVHAKWMARRNDLGDDERIGRALTAFAAIPNGSEFGAQARYFEGALLVQRGALADAAFAFQRVLALPQVAGAPSPAEAKIPPGLSGEAAVAAARAQKLSKLRDLARLALGRVLFEQGDVSSAIDRYQEIDRDSESFQDALYELSACWQKIGEFEKALRSTELLLLMVEESTIAPEARLQQAGLELKLKRYGKAITQYEQIAAEYRPVHERIQQLTQVPDPVAYYNELLERGERTLDTTQLLPDVARKFVAGRDAGKARGIIEELIAGRQGLEESRELLKRLDRALKAGKLELFPTLQEGNVRAVEVENALIRAEGTLTGIESHLIEGVGGPGGAQLLQARAARAALDDKVAQLPDTAAAFEERRRQSLAKVAELDKQAFRLGVEIDSFNAQLAAAEKWQRDSAAQRAGTAGARKPELEQAEREFARRIENDRGVVHELEQERQTIRRALEASRGAVAGAVAGGAADERLRGEYLKALGAEEAASKLLAAGLAGPSRALEARIQGLVAQINQMRRRAVAVRTSIRDRAAQKLSALRGRLQIEAESLAGYDKQVGTIEGGTKQLLGRIAYESFARVGRIFYDLVLKADVGVIDAAWTQKRERTDSITALEEKKQRQLKDLAEEFGEVLKEVE
jgi:uncharacterized coiled-coil protein SlyX/uncharacterized protein YjiS (DUF1127 family)